MNEKYVTRMVLLVVSIIYWGAFQPTLVKASSQSVYGTPVHLTGTVNTHDLGGIITKNDHHIKKGLLIRSDALSHLTKKDKWQLTQQKHVGTIIDFRSAGEIKIAKDRNLSGIIYRHDSVMANRNFGVHTRRQYANQLANKHANSMQLFYQKMVTNPYSIKAYHTFANQLLNRKQGAYLYHCTYGKDRTGIATMLILSCLGVSKQTIMKNYLASNKALKALTHTEYRQLKRITHNQRALANFKRSKAAKRSYLNAAYRAIDQHYGSMNRYLNVALGLSTRKIHALRTIYLTK
ncbi:tyrosine-protein phosphatase [Lentilactobacillus kisonensis]|uniref:Tyrosine specific protein phosphatases domain-containing protein n=2 Tax=Lentilactobacillus kisonensis TaxID=481722 RepID=H1LIU2_9LACO|nr:tyrosine-protein phosphatase [Lentilactobacillus kisonensis]EHO49472.1 hypothetical protein HMPREF9104_02534 [Lentilactobacillus kisonensis F0435]KRL21434.1 hypothetical protein FC98_GL000768 [Lentilactobacillus kisonensis DSM 19906 = JCM 15041]